MLSTLVYVYKNNYKQNYVNCHLRACVDELFRTLRRIVMPLY